MKLILAGKKMRECKEEELKMDILGMANAPEFYFFFPRW